MNIVEKKVGSYGIRLSVMRDDKEVGRAYVYIMTNDLHKEPFGLLEDVFIDEDQRGNGAGTELVNQIIEVAKREGCYKLIATSRYARPKVHALYEKIGFKDQGKEFRMDL